MNQNTRNLYRNNTYFYIYKQILGWLCSQLFFCNGDGFWLAEKKKKNHVFCFTCPRWIMHSLLGRPLGEIRIIPLKGGLESCQCHLKLSERNSHFYTNVSSIIRVRLLLLLLRCSGSSSTSVHSFNFEIIFKSCLGHFSFNWIGYFSRAGIPFKFSPKKGEFLGLIDKKPFLTFF